MTGENAFRNFKQLIPKDAFYHWLDSLRKRYTIFGPVSEGEQTVFKEISSSRELAMDYYSTMLSPGKLFIYAPKEELLRFSLDEKLSMEEVTLPVKQQIIVGVHPCDTNAILYLDRTFLGGYRDPFYAARREKTFIISLNCTKASHNCFCSSVGTGPFLKEDAGYDILLTDFEDSYLVEIKSERASALFKLRGKAAGPGALKIKADRERFVTDQITKTVPIEGLDKLFIGQMNHPVWQQTAEERCLSCSNCVLVCPTCFCYNIVDETSMDLKTVRRYRHLDACQDIRFAEVFGGNFRSQRAARLRQFVTHKMNQSHQYGMIGTVGCGRCITWCPTGIDLTEITKEIQRA